MPKMDVSYTTGVIATREKYLLKDRVLRLCELSPEEAFRILLESGFGGGAEVATGVYDFEKLIAVEEEKLDAFIREFAPEEKLSSYLLSPRDFHNAKALIKASLAGENADKMLAPDGIVKRETIKNCVESGDFSALYPALKNVCEEAVALTEKTGEKVGVLFEKALYAHLKKVAKGRRYLVDLLSAKVDMFNILISFRAVDIEQAKNAYLPGGKLKKEQLFTVFEEEKALSDFKKTDYYDFLQICLEARKKGLPMTQAEKIKDGYDTAYFAEKKYSLEKAEPFLYYVYRRKTECENVRIVFVCLLAGLSEHEIKRRLRSF